MRLAKECHASKVLGSNVQTTIAVLIEGKVTKIFRIANDFRKLLLRLKGLGETTIFVLQSSNSY